jgi:3'-phosphoadenosine 5'-phosphosulfate sulfotransferase (PAPS reductase)/FAD synthetase
MRARLTWAPLRAAFAVAALAGLATAASAQIPGDTIKIGVLSDFSGPFADQVGKGSLVGAQLAAEDFAKEAGGLKVEIIFADHQNKPDIGVAIARRWVDAEGVDAIVDLANSGVGLAVNTLMRDKKPRHACLRDRDLRPDGKILSADHCPMGSRHLGARKRGRPHDH